MTSIAHEPELSLDSRRWLDRLLALEIGLNAELVIYLALVGIAFVLHFWDLGSRALHHDESLHATYSYYLYKGAGYKHDPLMHGPVLFHLTALMYLLFGVSDATARFSAAFAGTALVFTPYFLRRWLGRWGGIAASAMLVFSPSMLYYSRFIREDILVALWTAGLFIGTWRFTRSGRPAWLYLAAASLALGFANKELTFMLAAVVLVYADVLLAGDLSAGLVAKTGLMGAWSALLQAMLFVLLVPSAWAIAALWRLFGVAAPAYRGVWMASDLSGSLTDRLSTAGIGRGLIRVASFALLLPFAWVIALTRRAPDPEGAPSRPRGLPFSGDVLIVVGTLTLPQLAPLIQTPLKLLHVNLTEEVATLSIPLLLSDPTTLTRGALIGGATVIALLVASAVVGLAWNPRRWLLAALVFYGIYVCLFTTFFTNPQGFASGIWGSLDYWLQQQDVQRGGQPVFYYLMMLPAYAYVPLALALIGIVRSVTRRGAGSVALLFGSIALMPAIVLVYAIHNAYAMPLVLACIAFAVAALRGDPLRQLLVFWFSGLLFGLSVAGEKMPWLTLHLELPLILLAGLSANDLIGDAVDSAAGRRRWWVLAAALVLGIVLVMPLAWGPGSDGLRAALFGISAAGALTVGAAVTIAWRARLGFASASAMLLGLLTPLSLHTAFSLSFLHGDTPYQALVYTQSSPEIPRILRRIDQYARTSGRGLNQPIVVDDNDAFSWPWAWYLRDYRSAAFINLQTYLGSQEGYRPPPNAIMLVNDVDLPLMAQFSGQFGPGIPYLHRWWFPEDYRGTTADTFVRGLRRGSTWARWWGLIAAEHGIAPPRTAPAPGEHAIGSVDSTAYFPSDYSLDGRILRAAPALPAARPDPNGVVTLGGPGSAPGSFLRPAGVAVDAFGNIYVADSQNNRVQKLGPGGKPLAVTDARDPQMVLREPWGVAVDKEGTVYVADTWNHRIVRLDSDLHFLSAWGVSNKESGPDDLFSLYGPRSIAFDPDGNLLVTDTGNGRVIRYTPDGDPLGSFGSPGNGPGEFREPVGIATDSDGMIYVADTWNGRVQVLNADGEFVGSLPVRGWESRDTENKPYLAVLANGDLLLTQPDSRRLVEVSPTGDVVRSIAAVGPNRPLVRPIGVAVAGGAVYIADGGANRVIREPLTALP